MVAYLSTPGILSIRDQVRGGVVFFVVIIRIDASFVLRIGVVFFFVMLEFFVFLAV